MDKLTIQVVCTVSMLWEKIWKGIVHAPILTDRSNPIGQINQSAYMQRLMNLKPSTEIRGIITVGYIKTEELEIIDRAISNLSKSVLKHLEDHIEKSLDLNLEDFPSLSSDVEAFRKHLDEIRAVVKSTIEEVKKQGRIDRIRYSDFDRSIRDLANAPAMIKLALERHKQNLGAVRKRNYPIDFEATDIDIATIDRILKEFS